MNKKTILVHESCYLHICNSGLNLSIEQDEFIPKTNDKDSFDYKDPPAQYLCASSSSYGIPFPDIRIPLLKRSQIDAMIKMLTNARERIPDDENNYTNETVEDPQFSKENE